MDRKIHCTENLCEAGPHAHEVQNFHLLLSNRDINYNLKRILIKMYCFFKILLGVISGRPLAVEIQNTLSALLFRVFQSLRRINRFKY